MAADDEPVVELLREVLAHAGDLKPRRMFGGYGFYLDGVFFALLFDGTLYFKTSPESVARYEGEGMSPFTYETKSGAHALKSYWQVPERLFDEPDELLVWSREAAGAARASKRPPKGGGRLGAKALANSLAQSPAQSPSKTKRPSPAPKTNPRARGARK